MLVQDFLRQNGLQALQDQYFIRATYHPTLPLVILNYDQIESPKTDPIVRECRGLVLEKDTWNLVARSFSRFFNWGELGQNVDFDFHNCLALSKEDGSLVIIYYYSGEWHANTRGSFGLDLLPNHSFTWRDAFCEALDIQNLNELKNHLNQNLSYVCEFVSPYNQVVRIYPQPQMYLLTAFEGENEVDHTVLNSLGHLFQMPNKYYFENIEAVDDFLSTLNDPTFEGIVLRDQNNQRWKVKSDSYLKLHRLANNGNICHPKNLISFILDGTIDDVLGKFPYLRPKYEEMHTKIHAGWVATLDAWIQHKHIEDQKEFALAVKDHEFSGVLFAVRRDHGVNQTENDLYNQYHQSKFLLKKLFDC